MVPAASRGCSDYGLHMVLVLREQWKTAINNHLHDSAQTSTSSTLFRNSVKKAEFHYEIIVDDLHGRRGG